MANGECDKLKQANTELQRQRDALEDEKDDVVKDKDRQVKENQRWCVCLGLVKYTFYDWCH